MIALKWPARRAEAPAELDPVDPVVWIQGIKAATRMRPERIAVAQALAVYADFGPNVRPTTVTVAKARRHIRRLRRDGWLAVAGKALRGGTVYALTLPSSGRPLN